MVLLILNLGTRQRQVVNMSQLHCPWMRTTVTIEFEAG
jgi:hypothetical protein